MPKRHVAMMTMIAALAAPCLPAAAGSGNLTGPLPRWVQPLPVPAASASDEAPAQYLLFDRQVRVAPDSVAGYRHFAMRVAKEAGLAEASQISIDFDPSYQRLSLHHVNVRRGGLVIDKLKPGAVQLLQRERDLEARVLDGRQTAHLVLEDIRVGDVVEYDYSVEGSNPALAGQTFGRCDQQFSVQVERLRCRLLWARPEPPRIKRFNGADEPFQQQLPGEGVEYVWERLHQAPLKVENDAPEWFDPYPYAQWSNSADWRQVIDWGLKLYAAPAAPGSELAAELQALKAAAASDEERVAAALRLVQGKVRYLGFEVGAGSYAPRPPDLVFKRRFGDCKDKALLLTTLLRAMDIKAWPALVNTRTRRQLAEALPSPMQFDHVIVKVRLAGKEWWLDPTRAAQQGPLAQIDQADFGQALVLDPQATGLQQMLRLPSGQRRLSVAMDASAGMDKPGTLTVRSVYTGQAADRMRAQLAGDSLEQFQKTYLNFYQQNYPGSSVTAPLEVHDDTARNELATVEHYRLPEPFRKPKDKQRREVSVYSEELREFLKTAGQAQRQSPLRLDHPVDIELRSELLLPRDWPAAKPDILNVDGPGFRYTSQVSWPSRRQVVMVESYRTLADEVEASRVPEYNARIKQVRESLGYTVYEPAPGAEGGMNWLVLLLALGGFAACLQAAWRLYRWDPAPEPAADGPRGLGGWLVLPGFGLIVAAVRTPWEGFRDLDVYGLARWTALTMPGGAEYHPMWAPTLLLELGNVIVASIGAILLLILFFTRRSSFPRLMIGFLWLSCLVNAIDLGAMWAVPVAQKLLPQHSALLVRALLSAAVWTAYLLRSKRVANTFVERRPVPRPPVALPLQAG
ncbi:DUF3857 domain-containing protein [Pelomonas sp. KK5]|uniref:DUF3857 domain-containing protein n=1 Tax=Pelomonas sp. KK5 TaxID=1855730 RepID=UPI0009FA018A|nr:DUF3857 domain-containing protein [Pelomonas sp. KK5]